MATMTVPIRLTWGYGQGSPGANVWHFRSVGVDVGGSDLEQFTDQLEVFYTAIAGVFNATFQAHWDGEATGLGGAQGTVFQSPTWTVSGADSGSVAPTALAILIQWRAQEGGRSGRGRTFLGPVAASAIESNGTPAEDTRATIQAACDDLIEWSDSFANGAFGVYSRTDSLLRDIVQAAVPNEFAVLRSRRD